MNYNIHQLIEGTLYMSMHVYTHVHVYTLFSHILRRNLPSYSKGWINKTLAYLVTPLQYNMVRYFNFLQPLRRYFKALSLQKIK